ncbi:hypothetical protein EX895_002077 [Sporisorium graminicola]|uniref:Protein BFR2 n=1 Tax=Sporisorium graminicola TaxID=280036 RepID=A0A4U7KX36_9BASI|nr:hypothetical protein EX895_002077 [Sporisorium graminicola]TKY88836.1 hypothetical protein EX895_002077 [Sporisorium graminicola]
MLPKGSSLASLLGTLTNAAPVEFDPEALDADQPTSSSLANGNHSASGSGSDDDEDDDNDEDQDTEEEEDEYMNPRAHYADVGPSDMRKKAALSESEKINDPRYRGVKSSRAELYADKEEDDDDEHDDDDDDDDDDEEEEDEDEDEDISEGDQDDDAPPKKAKQLRFAQEDNDDDDDSSESDSDAGQATTSNSIAAQIAQSASQAKVLKARRVQDADKGRQVSKQIKTYERTLETRIKAQSVLRDVNRLPDPALYTQAISSSPAAMEPAITVLEQLLELSETLFSLRTRLHALSSASDAGEAGDNSSVVAAPTTRKRKRDFDVTVPEDDEEAQRTWNEITAHDQIDATIHDIVDYTRSLEPQRRSVLDKWSLKVTSAAATAAAAGNGNKFTQLRAVNQPPSVQIDSALSGDGLPRLIARTRVLRSDTPGASKLGRQASTPQDDDVQDAQVFDDTDFYSTLLKELIERRSGVLSTSADGGGGSAALLSMVAGGAGKKKKASVDTKASKGRKLRFEVHDKLVNFMPPIRDRVRWGEEQIERLFRQLASSSMGVVVADGVVGDGNAEEAEAEADLAGLRVFG